MPKESLRINQQELRSGDPFSGSAFNMVPDTSSLGWHQETLPINGQIEQITGGGFFGKVLLFQDLAIKTAEPNPFHLLWRNLNWRLNPFPSQNFETAAQLDHLSTKIINLAVPTLTRGEVHTPASLGYLNLGELGYAQVLERMHGRGALFTLGSSDNVVIKKARQDIWNLGIALGLEQAAQVHPDNPFGKPNLWLGEDGKIIWLDVLPAIPHTGFVLPVFYFPFHKDVRQQMGHGELTFNRIHTDKFLAYVNTHKNDFSPSSYNELTSYLRIYDQVYSQYALESQSSRQEQVIRASLQRGLISSAQAEALKNSRTLYAQFLLDTISKPAIDTFTEFIKDTPVWKIFKDPEYQQEVSRFLHDPEYRRHSLLKSSILRGIETAEGYGLVSKADLKAAWQTVEGSLIDQAQAKKLTTSYLTLATAYFISGRMLDVLAITTYASSFMAEEPASRFALGVFIDWVLPCIVRPLITASVSAMNQQELNTAMRLSALPKLGSYLALSGDIGRRFGYRSEEIWHYTKRGLIASLSKVLRPWGGWNSDLEAKIWEGLGVEKW